MGRKGVIAFSISVVILLAVCILSIINVKNARDDAYTLSKNVEALEAVNILLQSENNELRETVASMQQDNNALMEATDTQQEDSRFINSIFEENSIDKYFLDMAQKIIPSSTVEMSEYAYIECAAWEAEMINCYEILKNIAKDPLVRDCLDNERKTYIEYIKANTELDLYFTVSGAFYGEENVWLGTLSHVLYPSGLSGGYKKKTMELFERLYEIGETPQFVFSKEEYDKQIQQTYPEKWQEIFG